MKEYTTVLFDWDGCLARTLEIWIDVCSQALTRQGITTSRAEIKQSYRRGGIAKMFCVTDMATWHKDIREIATEQIKNVTLYEGANELLAALSKTKQLAIVSDAHGQVLYQNLAHHRLTEYFQVVITRDDVGLPKPHPEGIEKALAQLGAKQESAVMIGDSAKDIQAAKNAGIDSILMYPHSHSTFYDVNELLSYEPTHIMNNFQLLHQQFIL